MFLLLFALLAQDSVVTIGESEIRVVLPDRDVALSREKILGWVKGCGETIADYYGKFPVPKVRLEISARRGGGIRSGRTWDGRLIRIQIGTTTTESELDSDWMLTHEMC